MTLKLDCPRGKYGAGMAIYCEDGKPCAHQYFKRCKGWYVLSDGAKNCPIRKERENGAGDTATAHSGDAV